MIAEADEALQALIEGALGEKVRLSFEPPAAAREAVPKTGPPLLDVHLVAIEEQRDLSATGFSNVRGANGVVMRTEPPRYIKLTYWLSAWGRDAASEHELLGRVLSNMAGIDHIPAALLSDGLQAGRLPVMVSVAAGQSVGQRVADVWSSLGEPMKAGIEMTLLVPMQVADPAETAALVLERRLRMTGPPVPPPPAIMAPPGIPGVLMPAAPAAPAAPATPGTPGTPGTPATPATPTSASPAAGAAPGAAPVGDDAMPAPPAVIEELTYGPEPGAAPVLTEPPASDSSTTSE
jgi:hypothetical protein